VAKARYREENLEEVQAEYGFFALRDATKKSEVKNKDDASPSMVIEQDEDDPFYMDID
jgi:hypothetical protein